MALARDDDNFRRAVSAFWESAGDLVARQLLVRWLLQLKIKSVLNSIFREDNHTYSHLVLTRKVNPELKTLGIGLARAENGHLRVDN